MNEIVKTNQIIRTFDDAERAARAMAGSGFFQDTRQASQAIVKILAGQELGFGPFASMTGVSIIQGKPAVGANLQAAALKRSGKYNYRVVEMTNDACEIAFFENGQEIGRSRFDMRDAAAAGLSNKDNWRKFPRNMLFARAISNGIRWYAPDIFNGIKWYAPDIFNGATVYTPDELGATEDDEGRVIDAAPVEHPEPPAAPRNAEPEPKPAPKKSAPAQQPMPSAPAASKPDTFAGMITPQDLIDEGIAENIPNAANILNRLKIAGKPKEFALAQARKYRALRDDGKTTEEAVEAVLTADLGF